jgi:deoxyribodipyrimidine photo-lyase
MSRGKGRGAAFVFQRDFRVADNAGFERAAATGKPLAPVFLMDDRQLDEDLNPYRSDRCVQLMAECLAELSASVAELGWADGVVLLDYASAPSVLAGRMGVGEVHRNSDFTPFAAARDAGLDAGLVAAGVDVITSAEPEYTLWDPRAIANGSGGAYKVYSPFARACEASGTAPRAPRKGSIEPPAGYKKPKGAAARHDPRSPAQRDFVAAFLAAAEEAKAGRGSRHRQRALEVLRDAERGRYAGYAKTRDDFASWVPGVGGSGGSGGGGVGTTTGLSVSLKFGSVSCREAYRAFRGAPELRAQLMWREFFAHLAAGHPEVLAGQLDPARGPSLNRHHLAGRDAALDAWRHGRRERALLARWEAGETGEPLVDAAMRQLAATGRMHNRLRMVAASHLVKALGVDWRLGERAFARMLTDYDPASNGGGWRAMDAQAPGREILAASQAKKRDPSGAYVRAWASAEPV